MRSKGGARGVTLIEVLVIVALVGLMSGFVMLGAGVADSARLRRSAVMIASAAKVAWGHANATTRTVRLVFNFDARTVAMEDSEDKLWLAKNDLAGGAAGATDAERKAIEEADVILKGPRAPRPSFRPAKPFGFNGEKGGKGKELERNIRLLQVETAHQDDPIKTGQAYLYFWPGGQTEQAGIQLSIAGSTYDGDVMTVLISPLTGKADIRKGRANMPRPRDDNEASERQDTGF
jgi:general secretion pathway protein H